MSTRARLGLLVVLLFFGQNIFFLRLRLLGVVPDVMLLLAICVGINGGPARGAVVGFVGGLLVDLFLIGTPEGLSALVFALVGYGVGALNLASVRAVWWMPILTVALASAAGELVFGLATEVLGQARPAGIRLFVVVVVVALFNALLAPLVLHLSRWALEAEDERPLVLR